MSERWSVGVLVNVMITFGGALVGGRTGWRCVGVPGVVGDAVVVAVSHVVRYNDEVDQTVFGYVRQAVRLRFYTAYARDVVGYGGRVVQTAAVR